MKHLYKKLHTNEVVDINFLYQAFQHNDVYMRDVIIGSQTGISESDMVKIQAIVMELCQNDEKVQKEEQQRLKKEKKEKKKKEKEAKKKKKKGKKSKVERVTEEELDEDEEVGKVTSA